MVLLTKKWEKPTNDSVEPRCNRRKASTSHRDKQSIGGALWPWVWLPFNRFFLFEIQPNLTSFTCSVRLFGKLLCSQNGGISSLASLPMSHCIKVCTLCSLLIFVFALGHVLIVSFIHSLFYCAHWQTYVSGTLQFGYVDVTEGQIVVMGVMLISSLEDFLDIDIWMSSVSTQLILVILETTFLSLALLLHPQPAGDPLWCCLWHLLHVQGDQVTLSI